jgi:hypothetical protein
MSATAHGEPRSRILVRLVPLLAGSILVASALLGASFVIFAAPGCACTSPPTHPPGWTASPPPALSIVQAEEAASRVVGEPVRNPYHAWGEFDGAPVLMTRNVDAIAYVHGNTGAVLTVIYLNALPSDRENDLSGDIARAHAADWLARAGVPTAGMTATAESRRGGRITYFAVGWTPQGAAAPSVEVLINGISGDVFAYRDLRSIAIPVPVIAQRTAVEFAEASPLSRGEAASLGGNDDLVWDGEHWSWQVGFNDGTLSVDAETGEVVQLKWAD